MGWRARSLATRGGILTLSTTTVTANRGMKLSTLNGWRRTALGIGVLACALLASCGGGNQASSYFATRVLAFGDESSVINADRSKYTVNALSTSGTTTSLDCTTNPIWIQAVMP